MGTPLERFLLAFIAVVTGLLAAAPGAAAEQQALWDRIRDRGLSIARDLKDKASLNRSQRDSNPAAENDDTNDSSSAATDGSRLQHSRVAAPSFSRITIEPKGATLIECKGTPGSRVIINEGGRAVASAVVEPAGPWKVTLEQGLPAGDHRITSSVQNFDHDQIVAGQDVRISMPAEFSGRVVVAYNGNSETHGSAGDYDPARARAEDLARAASERFTEVMPKVGDGPRVAQGERTGPARTGEAPDAGDHPVMRWLERAAKSYQKSIAGKLSEPVPNPGGKSPQNSDTARTAPVPGAQDSTAGNDGLLHRLDDQAHWTSERVQDWLSKAKRSYRSEIARKLSVPQEGPSGRAVARTEPARVADPGGPAKQAEPSSRNDDALKRAEEARRKDAEWDRLEDAARKEADARRLQDENAHKAAEAARRDTEEKKQADEAKRQAEARRLQQEAARKQAEAKRQAEEAQRQSEAKRLQEETARKQAEVKRLAEEAQKQAEAKRAQEETARKEAEAKRIQEDNASKEAEVKRLSEEAKKQAESERLAAEARRRQDDEARRKETASKREGDAAKKKEEAKRLTDEAARKDAERKRLAEEAKNKPPAKPADAVEEERRAEEKAEQEADAERLAADLERRNQPDEDTESRVAPRRASKSERNSEPKVSLRRHKDTRPAEGSAQSADDETGSKGKSATVANKPEQAARAESCRAGKTRRTRWGLSYVVRPGDTLWGIASRYYRRGARYNVIYRANAGRIDNPDIIRPCQRIIVPMRRR